MQTSKASAELEKTKKEMAAAVAGEKAEKRAAVSALDAEKAAKAMLEKHHGSVSLPCFFSFLACLLVFSLFSFLFLPAPSECGFGWTRRTIRFVLDSVVCHLLESAYAAFALVISLW